MREFIADVPSPGPDHRKDKPSTLLEQNVIDARVVRADLVRHMRDVELDGATATRFEVDEEQPVLGGEEVARMRFAVQQLLGSSAAADLSTRGLQRADKEMAIGLGECGGCVSVRAQPLSRCCSFHEVRRRDLDTSRPRVQAVECVCGFDR